MEQDRYKVVYVRRSDGAISSSEIFTGDQGAIDAAAVADFRTDKYTKAIVVGF